MFLHELFNFFVLLVLELLQLLPLRLYNLFNAGINHHRFHFQTKLGLEPKFTEFRFCPSNFLFVVFDDRSICLLSIISIIEEAQNLRLTLEFYGQVSMRVKILNQTH